MIVVERRVASPADADTVFGYLSDFTTTTEWDPGSVRTERMSGTGDVGTEYHNVSRFAGRETELLYTVTERRAPRTITLRGKNKTIVATDTITVEPAAAGAVATYRAAFELRGAWRVLEPFIRPAFRRLGDDAEKGLREALARL